MEGKGKVSEPGFLVLENGQLFQAVSHQGGQDRAGEVVFNTSHSGYEEIATDPSYYNQIMVMTAPMQGNYGVSDAVWESDRVHIQGFVCLECGADFESRLASYGVPVLSGVDTRSVVLSLREKGTLWGAVVRHASKKVALSRALHLIKSAQKMKGKDWPFLVSTKKLREFKGKRPTGPRVAVLDFGCKQNIIRELVKRSSQVALFPCRSRAKEILKWKPDGVVLSNGPGDPACVLQSVGVVKELLGTVFVFGICMGHQILALALGGRTYKLKFGHRGGNHPVRDRVNGKIYVTAQNHGYAVEAESLPSSVRLTHINLNDQSVEGFMSPEFMGIQFHPESHPGPHEACELFDHFVRRVKEFSRSSKGGGRGGPGGSRKNGKGGSRRQRATPAPAARF